MKNKTRFIDQEGQITIPDWLCPVSSLLTQQRQGYFFMLQETQEEDFLSGKIPQDVEFTWEEEE